VQLVHPLLTAAAERQILKERGVSYSTSPVGEARRPASAGVIQLAELLEAGVKVSISTDNASSYSFDYFASMRMLYALHQHRVGQRVPLTAKRLVQLATLDGASISDCRPHRFTHSGKRSGYCPAHRQRN
jgi:cytosine/adenosine deaminase-related metal-dependent hydrolase